jgi:hypothetical protein
MSTGGRPPGDPSRYDPEQGRWVETTGWSSRPGTELAGGRQVPVTPPPPRRRLVFLAILALAVVASTIAVLHGRSSAVAPQGPVATPGPPIVDPTVLFISRASANFDKLASVPAADTSEDPTIVSGFACDRVDFRGGRGVCLTAASGVPEALVFDSSYNVLDHHGLQGPPSRVRVAPDGRKAAMTVFTAGSSYAAAFSTATTILDLGSGADLGNLESFATYKDGQRIHAVDFNFWGVTWMSDSNGFYATLGTAGHHYLVKGNLKQRSMTVVTDGVECPSLSPDGTRIAFKKVVGTVQWRLYVLDLRTMKDHAVAEPNVLDDQAQWLDDNDILFDPFAGSDVLVVPADGSGSATTFLADAKSPVVVRP